MKVELSAQELAVITAWGAYVEYEVVGVEPMEAELLIRLRALAATQREAATAIQGAIDGILGGYVVRKPVDE